MAETTATFAKDTGTPRLRTFILELVENHECSRHAFFEFLASRSLGNQQIASLLRNYDAHASVLRRLLLNAASIMPEEAVAFILENVRNEYGNGDYSRNHQAQLRDLAWSCGISRDEFFACRIQDGVADFIKEAARFYWPRRSGSGLRSPSRGMKSAAIAAGAITATELLAIKEFACMQKSFVARGLQHHIWFHHVDIEVEHSDESLALALHFAEQQNGLKSVEHGLRGILDANIRLYDGLLAAAQGA